MTGRSGILFCLPVLLALAAMATASADGTGPEGAAVDPLPTPKRLALSNQAFRACTGRLRRLGAAFEILEPIVAEDPECGIERPLRIDRIARGVALRPSGPMRCETALALADWVENFVIPASERLPDRGLLTEVVQGSTYVCRRRNNRPTGKLSEHAFGNAVDVMAFRFASGKPIPIVPREREGTPAESFQRAVRYAACLNFSTVLGPGSDEAHKDHLHLDIAERGGDFRLCQ